MFEQLKSNALVVSAEEHCHALSRFVTDESKHMVSYAQHHRAETTVVAAGLTSAALFVLTRGRIKSGTLAETVSELEAVDAKATSGAGQVAEHTLGAGAHAGGSLASEIADLQQGVRLNKSSMRLVEGTGVGKSWRQIYTDAFPAEQRDPTEMVVGRLKNDGSKLFETKGRIAEAGKTLRDRTVAFSVVEPIGEGSVAGATKQYKLLSWHATRDGFRSEGIGGQHLDQVLKTIRDGKDTAAVAVEIEHTGLKNLPNAAKIREMLRTGKIDRDLIDTTVTVTKEEQTEALRRAAYYLEHGAKVADVKYAMINLADMTKPPMPAHLLYFEGLEGAEGYGQALNLRHVKAMVKSVLCGGYELDKRHEFVTQMLGTVGKTLKPGG